MPCRSCGAGALEPVFSLGSLPLSNALVDEAGLSISDELHPLDLDCCVSCGMLGIRQAVAPERLFREYLYYSSYSATAVEHAHAFAQNAIAELGLGPKSLVIEVASNDGYLLSHFHARGIATLGIEPARNVADVARSKGVQTVTEFFDKDLAPSLPKADLVIANNVLAHVPDPNGFVSGLGTIVRPGGTITVEVPSLLELVDNTEFDTVYHEHFSYFSATSLDALFARNGLAVERVDLLVLHGGSLRFTLRKGSGGERPRNLAELLSREAAWGVRDPLVYRMLAHKVSGMKAALSGFLQDAIVHGRSVAGYGAPAKATVFLNHFGLGPDKIPFVVDRNPHKQGRYIPGVRIPIRSVDLLRLEKPDFVLVLPWNLANEIIEQEQDLLRQGSRFVVAIPSLRLI